MARVGGESEERESRPDTPPDGGGRRVAGEDGVWATKIAFVSHNLTGGNDGESGASEEVNLEAKRRGTRQARSQMAGRAGLRCSGALAQVELGRWMSAVWLGSALLSPARASDPARGLYPSSISLCGTDLSRLAY